MKLLLLSQGDLPLASYMLKYTLLPPPCESNSIAWISQRTGSGRGGNDNSSGRDSRSDGSDGISSSEHRRIVEQLRLAEEEHSR